jgi:hypothetical protein
MAAMAGMIALGTVAMAADNAPAGSDTAAKEKKCTRVTDPPHPLGLTVRTISIIPSLDPTLSYGASMRGSCVGTKEYADGTQAFRGAQPYPASWWGYRAHPGPGINYAPL